MDAVVVNQHALHLEVGLFTILLVIEFDERILQAVTRALVPDDFAGQYGAEATEDEVEVLVYR